MLIIDEFNFKMGVKKNIEVSEVNSNSIFSISPEMYRCK